MTGRPQQVDNQQGHSPGLMLFGAVAMLALPSAVLAFSSGRTVDSSTSRRDASLVSPESQNSLLAKSSARQMLSLAQGQLFRFTPAQSASRPDSVITVVVRVDPELQRRAALANAGQSREALTSSTPLQTSLTPTAFQLGTARGYSSFAQPVVQATGKSLVDIPDIAAFRPREVPDDDSRFNTRILLDRKQATGRAPRTFGGEGSEQVELGGSYRLNEKIDVTAGVRVSQQQRDRLSPVTNGKKDNQAVYVGTQFRF